MEESDATPSSHTSRNTKEPLSSVPGCKDGGELPEVEDEGVNTGCGWFRFRPKILAPFAHVWTFIILYIVFSFTHAVQGSYPIAVLTTLERRFNLSSFLAGVVVNISVLGYIVSIIIFSIFLTKTHKPRLFAFCMLVTATGAFLYFLPHLVIQTGNDAITVAHAQTTHNATLLSESGGSGSVQLCGDTKKSGMDGSSSEVERKLKMCSAVEMETAFEDVSHVVPAVIMLCMADLVHGISAASIWTVGLVFIDDHTAPQLSAKLIGLMYTVRLISPIVSFAMGGYLLSIHSTLKETDLTPKHPQWIGAWWMGFLINAIINFIIFIPMSMLPRNLRPIRKSMSSSNEDSPENGKTIAEEMKQVEDGKKEKNGKEEEDGKVEGNGKELENGKEEDRGKGEAMDEDQNTKETKEKEEENVGIGNENEKEEDETEMKEKKEKDEENKEDGRTEEEEDMKTSVVPFEPAIEPMKPNDASQIDWKEFPRAMTRLITNPIYVLTVIAICSDWSVLSFMSFMPKYFEVHFQKTASVANLLGGMIPATFAAAASYVGGVVTGKIKGKDGGVAGLCRMNFSASLISVLLLGPALLLSCPNISHSGQLVERRLNVTTDCNVNCGCSSDVFDPVCGSDQLLYFSPCHAGCTQLVNLSTAHLHNDRQGRLVRSEECRCVADADESDEDGGLGGGIVFAGFCDDGCQSLIPYVFSLVAFVVAFSMHNASATTTLLRCIKKEDKSFALGLETLCICFAIFPAPLLYGRVFDASCILKRTASCTESEGTCLLYDRHALRLTFHGLTIGLKSFSTILFCATYFFGRRKLSQLTAQQQKMNDETAELNELNTNTKS